MLPHENYGHVILTSQSVVLLYRVSQIDPCVEADMDNPTIRAPMVDIVTYDSCTGRHSWKTSQRIYRSFEGRVNENPMDNQEIFV
jgi:hypothetical protein